MFEVTQLKSSDVEIKTIKAKNKCTAYCYHYNEVVTETYIGLQQTKYFNINIQRSHFSMTNSKNSNVYVQNIVTLAKLCLPLTTLQIDGFSIASLHTFLSILIVSLHFFMLTKLYMLKITCLYSLSLQLCAQIKYQMDKMLMDKILFKLTFFGNFYGEREKSDL